MSKHNPEVMFQNMVQTHNPKHAAKNQKSREQKDYRIWGQKERNNNRRNWKDKKKKQDHIHEMTTDYKPVL